MNKPPLREIRNHWKRWQARKTWWVCEYWINPDGAVSESGSFAEFGDTKEQAEKNAIAYIKEHAYANGECKYKVRRPNWHEALFG